MENLTKLFVADGSQPAAGPDAPDGREMQRYLTAALIAALPCIGAMMAYFGLRVPSMVLASVLGAVSAELLFAAIRKKSFTGGSVAYGVMIALFMPPTIPLWMIFAGGAFGVFFGKEIFGGTGHHVFSPVVVGKAFVLFSFPKLVDKQPYLGSLDTLDFEVMGGPEVAAALGLFAAIAMIVAKPGNARILLAIVTAGVSTAYGLEGSGALAEGETSFRLITMYGFMLGAGFVACDPSCAPRKWSSQWFFGFTIGATAVLMCAKSTYTEGMMSAILFANLIAPTLDAIEAIPLGRRAAA